ncbi:MAG: guanylate kinase [Planctomycetes bacterium]|nr:guanylate kinase [Planctomycetota bacterium]
MVERKSIKGRLVIVSGPSGVGKSTICKEVVKRLDNVCMSVSLTTRPKSEEEIDGKDYRFVSKEQFSEQIKQGNLLEYAEVFGNLYGTPKDKVEQCLQSGKTVILEIDVQGARQAKHFYPDAEMIFILPPTQKELLERMNGRGREDIETAAVRLNGASGEIAAAWQYYKHMVINDDLQQAVDEVIEIIKIVGE